MVRLVPPVAVNIEINDFGFSHTTNYRLKGPVIVIVALFRL